MAHYADKLGITFEELIDLGKENPGSDEVLYERVSPSIPLQGGQWRELATRQSIAEYVCPSLGRLLPQRATRRLRHQWCTLPLLDSCRVDPILQKIYLRANYLRIKTMSPVFRQV